MHVFVYIYIYIDEYVDMEEDTELATTPRPVVQAFSRRVVATSPTKVAKEHLKAKEQIKKDAKTG